MNNDIEKTRKKLRKISPSKSNAMYNSNMYWSQKPYNVCDVLIEELSEKGDVILDPFLGSGVTVLESVKKAYLRKAIGCEINEAPLSIVKTLLKQYDIVDYTNISQEVIKKIKLLSFYYETECPFCSAPAIISNVRFDMESKASGPLIKEIKADCPNCGKISKEASKKDYDLQNSVYIIKNIKKIPMKENSKLAVHKGETIEQIFTNRNFKVIDEILGIFQEYPKYTDLFNYILMSVLHLCKITDTHSNSQWPLWIPKTNCIEKNAINIICKKIIGFKDTISYINSNYNFPVDVKLLHKGSQYINEDDIPNNSVSLIITDPPYLGQVAYSEYMQLYEPFIDMAFNLEDEIIVTSTPDRKITTEEYFRLLDTVFGICDAKMKMGGCFCMYFHDSNLSVWDKLISSMADHHFKYVAQEHVKKTVTLKNIISPKKSLSGDALLFFVKEPFEYKKRDPSESIEEIENNIIKEIRNTISIKGSLTTPELYDGGLIEYLVYNGWLNVISTKYKTLVELFEKCLSWNSSTNKWELK